jgi:DNA-binding HxlR family transcriptional regulator
MLTQALRELETDALIKRHVYLEVPPRVEYSLDIKGSEMIPAIELFYAWAVVHMEKNKIPFMTGADKKNEERYSASVLNKAL